MPTTPARLPFQWSAIDPSIRREIVYHEAADGVPLSGVLYQPPSREPDTVVLAMHPLIPRAGLGAARSRPEPGLRRNRRRQTPLARAKLHELFHRGVYS